MHMLEENHVFTYSFKIACMLRCIGLNILGQCHHTHREKKYMIITFGPEQADFCSCCNEPTSREVQYSCMCTCAVNLSWIFL